MKVHIPLRKLTVNVKFDTHGRGVIPDYEARKSFQDKINQVDRVVEFAFELARK